MKIKTLSENQAMFTFYNIRERQAANQLQEADELIRITHISDEESYTSWDVVLTSGATIAVAELKVRKKFSDSFDDFIFEKIKYDELKKCTSTDKGKRNKVKPFFITFFFDCIAVWDITNLKDDDFKPEVLRSTSVNGNKDKKEKLVTYLKLEDAHIINYQLDYDKLNLNAKTIFKYKYPNNKLNIN